MNIRELKRRLQPYSGYMKPAEEGGPSGTGSADEELDLGNDLPDEGSATATAQAAPSPAPAPAEAPTADAAPGGDEGEDASKPGGGIPRARFNEVNDRRKALESENEELRAQLAAAARGGVAPAPAPTAAPQPAPVDVDTLEEQYTQALLDGDSKAAVALRKQINQHIKEAALLEFEQVTQQHEVAARSQDVVANAIATYPWLEEPEGAEALELIEAAVQAKRSAGIPHHVALTQAIATIAPRFAPDGTPSRGLPGKAAPVDTRLKAADERGASHSLLQPAAVQAGMGNRATAPKIDGSTKLTDDQIQGMSKDDLDKALGNA